jgi:hydantoinase/carbamoylase family amidase
MPIQMSRLKRNILQLAKISDGGNGVTRRSSTKAYAEGLSFVTGLMQDAGMRVRADRIGNLIGRLEGESLRKQSIILGSHIDTVPHGGMFDGAVGVLGGIEVIKTLREEGYNNKHPLEVISFFNEEGSAPVLIGGTFGSRVMMGLIKADKRIKENLKKINLTEEDIKASFRNPKSMKFYLELHIEQGKVLFDKKISIGIVTGIVGKKRYLARIKGTPNHAGTTPMCARDDAVVNSLPLLNNFCEIVKTTDRDMVGTIGKIEVKPGAQNVIPGEVDVTLEMRHIDFAKIDKACKKLEKLMKKISKGELILVDSKSGSLMDRGIQTAIEKSCQRLGISYQYMPSGAGHDAREMAKKVPSGMIFIPSKEGISHSPEEFTEWNDIGNGVKVLLDAVKELDQHKK